MCGIAGTIDLGRDVCGLAGLPERMARALSRRGPDAGGVYQDAHALLVHRRLIVVDPAGGGQPMYDPERNIILIYNGELYNTEDIRRELARPRAYVPRPFGYRGRAARLSGLGHGGLPEVQRHLRLCAMGQGGAPPDAVPRPPGRQAAVLCAPRANADLRLGDQGHPVPSGYPRPARRGRPAQYPAPGPGPPARVRRVP